MRAEAGRADMLRALGEYDEAETHYERARDLARASDDLTGSWDALRGLADLAMRRGQNEAGERPLRRGPARGRGRSARTGPSRARARPTVRHC